MPRASPSPAFCGARGQLPLNKKGKKMNISKVFEYASRFRAKDGKENETKKKLFKTGKTKNNADSHEFESYLESWINCTNTKVTAPFITNLLMGADEGQPREQAALFQTILEKEPVIAAHLQTRILSVLACDWGIKPVNSDTASITKAKETGTILRKAGFYKLMKHLLDAIGTGYAGRAIMWGEGGAKIDKFIHVHPSNWTFDLHGNPAVTRQDGIECALSEYHPNQFVFHTQQIKPGIPCRGGLLRSLVWLYFFKHYAMRDRARYLERFGIPFLLAKVRKDDFDNDNIRNDILNSLAKMGNDGVGLITEGSSVDTMTPSRSSGNGDFQEWLEYIDDAFALVILGQLASSKAASGLSKGQVQENVRHDLLEADCRNLMETVNNQLIAPLEKFRYGTQDSIEFKLEFDPKEDLKKKAEIVKILSDSGFKVDKKWIEKTFDIPISMLASE